MDTQSAVLNYKTPTLIIGGGIAGICAALELLEKNQTVLLIDRDKEEKFGGMANEAFGGMHFVDTPLQRLNGIKDNKELALNDWLAAAEFGPNDVHAKQWAHTYIERNKKDIYEWLMGFGIRFFPIVHWVERGDFGFAKGARGNSVPRYHVAWGTGWGVTQTLIKALFNHRNAHLLTVKFNHHVQSITCNKNGDALGCTGFIEDSKDKQKFEIESQSNIVCAGGINGSLLQVKKHWDKNTYGPYPENMLSGSHPYADGELHDDLKNKGASIKNLGWMWNYASGIKHPAPEYKNHGLSIMPARSALWLDANGKRIGPMPLITGFDTHNLCKVTGHSPQQYTWMLMNWKIAKKELAVSGSHLNKAFKNKSWLGIIKMALSGNPEMVRWLMDNSDDVVYADNLTDLVKNMNAVCNDAHVDLNQLSQDVKDYDGQIERGEAFATDDQIRRIHFLRKWRGDKARTLKLQKIIDEKAGPLIAIRARLISRKSMGGFETNIQSQVLNQEGNVVKGLYAAGEAAGFGGAGCAGIRSLEGTFLSSCILNGRIAAQTINALTLSNRKENITIFTPENCSSDQSKQEVS